MSPPYPVRVPSCWRFCETKYVPVLSFYLRGPRVCDPVVHYVLTRTNAGAEQVPLEQYFTSDYRQLLRDGRHNVVDAFTNQPPHLAQTGDLVDLIGNAYPEEAQPNKVCTTIGYVGWGGRGI